MLHGYQQRLIRYSFKSQGENSDNSLCNFPKSFTNLNSRHNNFINLSKQKSSKLKLIFCCLIE